MEKKCFEKVLLVGEGDFSLSVSLMNLIPSEHFKNVTTSSIETWESIDKHMNAKENMKNLQENGIIVKLGIDATKLHACEDFQAAMFKCIIFNFPHVGGKTNLKKNRKLLNDFFASSAKILQDKGQIMVTLCKGQGGTPADRPIRAWHDTWQVVSMAANSGLILRECLPFKAHKYAEYKSTGFRSQDKGFNTDGAITHIFEKAKSVSSSDCHMQYLKEKLSRNLHLENENPICLMRKMLEKLLRNICLGEFSQDVLTKNISSCILHNNTIEKLNSMTLDLCQRCYVCQNDAEFDVACTRRIVKDEEPDKHLCISVLEHLLTLDFSTKITQLITCMVACPVLLNSSDRVPIGFETLLIVPLTGQMDNLEELCIKVTHAFNDSFSLGAERRFSFQMEEGINGSLGITCIAKMFLNCTDQVTQSCVAKFLYYRLEQCFLLKIDLCDLVCKLYDVTNARLFWSKDIRVLNALTQSVLQKTSYKQISLYPMAFQHDMSFWECPSIPFDDYIFCDIVINVAGDTIFSIHLLDTYADPEKALQSRCYRLVFQSFDKALSYSTSWEIQSKIRLKVAEKMSVILR